MDRIKVSHGNAEFYVLFNQRFKEGHIQVHVRGMESAEPGNRLRIAVPGYKKGEIRQKLEDLYGKDVEVYF